MSLLNNIKLCSLNLYNTNLRNLRNIKLLRTKLRKNLLFTLAICTFIPFFVNSIEVPKNSLVEPNKKLVAQLYLADSGIPWGMVWSPQGDMLITMRGGDLKIIKKGKSEAETISGLPKIAVGSQGGLLDIIYTLTMSTTVGYIFLMQKPTTKEIRVLR